jgi:Di-haem oxidoreductase, putative peroxidase
LCHAQPALGGSGGFIVPNPGQGTPLPSENPLFGLVPRRFGKLNKAPSFEEQYGPIREVRFKYNPDGSRDGSVHQLYTVRGVNNDPTIPDCALRQLDFAAEQARGNLSFRIPLQMLGLGLIDSIQDREILARHEATASKRAALGIEGHPNRSGNDNTIARFGWKAQNKSLTMFAAEAYNVEMGITNELFPTAKEEDPKCNGAGKPAPNDMTRTKLDDSGNQAFRNPLHIMADWMQFTFLMRFMDAPQPDPRPTASALRRARVFSGDWLRLVSYAADENRSGDEQRGAARPTGQSFLRPHAASHGRPARRRHHPRRGGAGRISHDASLGRGTTNVLLSRGTRQRSTLRHQGALLASNWGLSSIGSQCGHQKFHRPTDGQPTGDSRLSPRALTSLLTGRRRPARLTGPWRPARFSAAKFQIIFG